MAYKKSGLAFQGVSKAEYNKELQIQHQREQEGIDIAEKLHAIAKKTQEELKKTGAFTDYITGNYRKRMEIQKVINKDGEIKRNVEKEGLELTQKELDASTDLSDQIETYAPNMKRFAEGIEESIRDFKALAGKVGFVVAALVVAVQQAIKFAKEVNEIRGDFGIAATEAMKLNLALKGASYYGKAFMLDSEDMKQNFDVLVGELGVANKEMAWFNVQFSRTVRNSGLNNQNAADFLSILMSQEGVTKELALSELDRLTTLSRMEGVAPSEVFKDLAADADLFASLIGNSTEELIKATAAAKKLGFEFGNIVELGDSLLNVTDRINKEQQLSLILGRQVRLDRVAILNAQGRVDAAQRELASQLRGFGQLGGLQQRQVSGIMGAMNVAELNQMMGLLSEMNSNLVRGNRDRRNSYL